MLPFLFDIRRTEKQDNSMLVKRCINGRHVPTGKGVISGRADGKGKVVVHYTCMICGVGYVRTPSPEEKQIYEKIRGNPSGKYTNSFLA